MPIITLSMWFIVVDIYDRMYKIRKGGIKSVLFGDEIKSTHSKPPTFRKLQRKVYQINLATAENQTHKFSGHRHRLQSRYDNVTLIPLVLQLGLRIGPIQRMGANLNFR